MDKSIKGLITKNISLIGCAAAFFAVFSWSLSGVIVKIGLSQIEPAVHVFFRLFFASIIVSAYWYLTRTKELKIFNAGFLMFLSFCLLNIINTFAQTYALKQVPYSWYVILFAFQPIIALGLINFNIFLKKSIIGVFLSCTGVFLFIQAGSLESAIDLLNLASMLFAILVWTGYTLFVNKLNAYYTSTEIALFTVVSGAIGALIMVIVLCFNHKTNFFICNFGSKIFIQILVTSFLTSAVYVLYSTGLRLAPSITIMMQYVDPITGSILALIFLHETLTVAQVFGALFIISGIYFSKKWLPSQLKT